MECNRQGSVVRTGNWFAKRLLEHTSLVPFSFNLLIIFTLQNHFHREGNINEFVLYTFFLHVLQSNICCGGRSVGFEGFKVVV